MPFFQDIIPDLQNATGIDMDAFIVRFVEFLPSLIASLFIFIVGIYLSGLFSRILRRALERRQRSLQIIQAITRITYWTLLILFTTIALQTVGFNLTAFLTGLGILGFTVGFALQDVSKNFIAGLLLLLQEPFEIGDAIEVAGFGGKVTAIELRATELRTFDGRVVLIPNADVFTGNIINLKKSNPRRVEMTVGVAYGSKLEEVSRVAQEAVKAINGVIEDPAPIVFFHEFGDSSIDLSVFFWVNTDILGFLDAKHAGVVAINNAFEAAGIEIPFPIRTVYMHNPA
jgi:small conductance mechanosensitive channel